MKTRNSPKPAQKKTPPIKKTPTSTTTATPPVAAAPPKTSPDTVLKQLKSGGAAATTTTPKVAEASVSTTNEVKTGAGDKKKVTRVVKTIVKKKVLKPKPPKPVKSPEPEAEKPAVIVEETPKNEEAVVSENEEQVIVVSTDELSTKEEPEAETETETVTVNVEESLVEMEPVVVNVEESPKKEEVVDDVTVEKVEEPVEIMQEDAKEDDRGKAVLVDLDEEKVDEIEEDYGEEEGFEEPGDEELAEDNTSDPEEDVKSLEEENREITALAKERKSKKEQEIFVGGLDRDTTEKDISKAFEKIGEVVEVRLHKNQATNKNKGYAFVKFATKELANKALSELKNPVIRGKRCGVAPSEDNDTLFVGNICNTWTKEAVKKKLKEYGLERIENITLVADPQHEGLSRGFSFVEFSCHADAMLAYKRLQKPDVIFGHAERTVKVAFAEPLREPDPEVMAQVKSVFIDGLPPHWDEERVREHFKPYGEIDKVVLARNMPSAKRKDFGFVDYKTHEAAIACIDGVNNTELGDEKSKAKVKVRLSNPLPKTQAVKGGLCGGFRIGRSGSGFSRFGRGVGHPFNRVNIQRGKDSRARGRTGRFAYARQDFTERPYSGDRGRRSFGGRSGFATGVRRSYNEDMSFRNATSSRSELGMPRYGAMERGHGRSTLPRRRPFSPEEHFDRPMGGRHYVDEPYPYDDGGYGLKRPYSMLDQEPGYLEPNRLRPRYDHPDPNVPSREARYQEPFGAGRAPYEPDYYHSPYGDGYSSMYRGERSYGGSYY